MYLFFKKIQSQKSNKTGPRNLFTLFHYIMEMRYPCSEVKKPYQGFTSCRDTAYAGLESNLNSKLLHDWQQHWFDSWREKDFLCCYKLRNRCLPSSLLFSPQVTLENTSGIFSWSKGTCKHKNQLQDPSLFKAPSQTLSLSIGLQPGKLLLITSYLLLFLPAVPSNISMCHFVQCQLGNAAFFKAVALGI